jgi:hypothetical protein
MLGGHSAIVRRVEGDTLYTVEGNYDGEVGLGRVTGWREDRRVDGVGILALPNAPPEVEIEAVDEIELPNALTLSSVVSDDGLPEDLTWGWTLVDGAPGDVFIEDPLSSETAVVFDAPGTYEFSLSVTDGELATERRHALEVLEPVPEPSPEDVAPEAAPPDSTFAGCAVRGSSRGFGFALVGLALGLGVARRRRRRRRGR